MRLFYDADANLTTVENSIIAVLGYGNQGRAQALNLRDSGLDVIIGNQDDRYAENAKEDGFKVLTIDEATGLADILLVLLPDEIAPQIYVEKIQPNIKPGCCMVFASGFNIAFGFIEPISNLDVVLVAPRMIGDGVRELFTSGKGFPCFFGVHQDYSGMAREKALAIARGIGATRFGAVEVTFEQEAELDLFTEQCFGPAFGQVLLTAVNLLLEEGYPPEAVLLELYMSGELAYSLSKIAELGMLEQTELHSKTSQYGSITRGMRFILPELREKMIQGLDEIRSGDFAAEWHQEHLAGYPTLESYKQAAKSLPHYELEKELRGKIKSSGFHPKDLTTHGRTISQKPLSKGSLLNKIPNFFSVKPRRKEEFTPLTPEQFRKVLENFVQQIENSPELLAYSETNQIAIGLTLEDRDDGLYIDIQQNRVQATSKPQLEDAELHLTMSSQTFDDLFSGRINPMRAALSGKIKFAGDTKKGLAFQQVQPIISKLYQEARKTALEELNK